MHSSSFCPGLGHGLDRDLMAKVSVLVLRPEDPGLGLGLGLGLETRSLRFRSWSEDLEEADMLGAIRL